MVAEMNSRKSLRDELDELKAELARLREQGAGAAEPAAPGAESPTLGPLGEQMAELNRLVQQMLEDAEETISEHPVATVAGALALGIVIGRLTAR
jgi:ElaB/YqjD/DUF883 family membrane-anchored ribosome-binding protein